MINIPREVQNYNDDRARRADASLARQLGQSIARNGLLRQQMQNLLFDLEYGHDEHFVKNELNRILLDT